MNSLMTSLGIDQMPPSDQLRLVAEILDNLADRAETGLTEAQMKEVDRRLAMLDAHKTTLSPWHEAEARVLGRLRHTRVAKPL